MSEPGGFIKVHDFATEGLHGAGVFGCEDTGGNGGVVEEEGFMVHHIAGMS